ncbi:MAG TPA: RsmE family RNA methyltransferase, partial [Phycisphaerae bacterium]|nr:RsmE family RNA methyltransferase [Phycisphaerae bacterium]
MSPPRFHVADLTGPETELPEAEARHALGSRRLSAGDVVILFDGRGREAFARIIAGDTRRMKASIERVNEFPRPRPALTLGFATPKGPRQDTLIEKCTELGVTAIQPIETARSVAGASAHRIDKWQRTTVEAAKQAGLAWLPECRDLLPFSAVLAQTPSFDLTLIALSAGNLPGPSGPSPLLPKPLGPEASDRREEPGKVPDSGGTGLPGLAGAELPRGCREAASIIDLLPNLQVARTILALIGPEGG